MPDKESPFSVNFRFSSARRRKRARQQIWLTLRLRSGRISPRGTSRHRKRRFPFTPRAGMLPMPKPDCHLVRTAIPYLPVYDSLDDFHSSRSRSLSSFASRLSRKNAAGAWPCARTLLFPFPTCSRKAGYTAHSVHGVKPGSTAMQVHIRYRTEVARTTMGVRPCTISGLRSDRVRFLMPLRSARPPQAIYASPQHPPQTGRKKQTPRDSQLCPSKDF